MKTSVKRMSVWRNLFLVKKSDFEKMSEEHSREVEKLNSQILEEKDNAKRKIDELELRLKLAIRETKDPKNPVQGQGTQTDSVDISQTPLSSLKENLVKNKDQSTSAVDQVYRSIRDLKCLVSYSEVDAGFECIVKIIKGKHVMKCPDLTNFSGQGKSHSEAKKSCFCQLY